MLSEHEFEAFKYEIRNWNNIPISSIKCSVGCAFCKITGDPILKRFPSLPAITLDDLYEGFKYIDRNYKYVRLGAGVMVATQTDPYLHKDIYEFIKHACQYFPDNMITTVTTGTFIDLNRIEYLRSFKNFKIDLSLITMQEDRETLIRQATREKLKYILENAPLNKITLMFTGDLEALKKDLEYLINLNLHEGGSEILVRRIEHTKYSTRSLIEISNRSIDKFGECAEFLRKNYPFVNFTVPYLNDKYRNEIDDYFEEMDAHINAIKSILNKKNKKSFLMTCPQSSYEYVIKNIQGYKNLDIKEIKNEIYGGSVTVAGLLCCNDIKKQVDNTRSYDYVILPKEMFDSEDLDLLGCSKFEIEEYFKSNLIIL